MVALGAFANQASNEIEALIGDGQISLSRAAFPPPFQHTESCHQLSSGFEVAVSVAQRAAECDTQMQRAQPTNSTMKVGDETRLHEAPHEGFG